MKGGKQAVATEPLLAASAPQARHLLSDRSRRIQKWETRTLEQAPAAQRLHSSRKPHQPPCTASQLGPFPCTARQRKCLSTRPRPGARQACSRAAQSATRHRSSLATARRRRWAMLQLACRRTATAAWCRAGPRWCPSSLLRTPRRSARCSGSTSVAPCCRCAAAGMRARMRSSAPRLRPPAPPDAPLLLLADTPALRGCS